VTGLAYQDKLRREQSGERERGILRLRLLNEVAVCALAQGCAFWSWNPGKPGTCFPKAATAANKSSPMKGYSWGVSPDYHPPPPPPPFTCNEAAGVKICNHSVYYTSCGMGQCDQNGCTTRVSDEDIAASVEVAKSSDVVIVNVAVTSTEGFDRL
jgi:hypothetical protein